MAKRKKILSILLVICMVMSLFPISAFAEEWDVEDQTECEHCYEGEVTEPACEEGGYTTYTCVYCGDEYVGDYTDAPGHWYQAEITYPTCTESGYTTYTCSDCGDEYVGDYTDALGHDFVEGICTRCGETDPDYVVPEENEVVPEETHTHTWDEGTVTVEATCTEDGVMTYACTAEDCDGIKTEVIPAAHSFENGFCTVCGEPDPDFVLMDPASEEALDTIAETDVAAIGDEGYESLQAAFSAAQNGDTVRLLTDVNATGSMYEDDPPYNLWISSGITLDGAGYTLTVRGRGIGIEGNNNDITFEDITIVNEEHGRDLGRCIDVCGPVNISIADSAIDGLWCLYFSGTSSGSVATIERCSFKSISNASDSGRDLGVVYFDFCENVAITASNSTFEYSSNLNAAWHGIANNHNSGNNSRGNSFQLAAGNEVTMTGDYAMAYMNNCGMLYGKDTVFYGSFVWQNIFDDINNAAEEGYEIFDNEDGTYTFVVTPVHYYWSDGNGGYQGVGCSFDAPFERGWLDEGEYIELQKDITLDKNLSTAKSFNLLLSGYIITAGEYAISIAVGKTVTSDTVGLSSLFSAPEGYRIVETASGDFFLYTVEELPSVAQIGEVKYKSLAAAVAAVQDGETIILLADITEDVEIDNGKTFSIDLNGKTLTGYADLYSGFVTLKDSAETKGKLAGTFYVNGGTSSQTTYNSFTLDSSATVESGYGIILYQNGDGKSGYGSTIDINGTVNGCVWVMGNITEGNSVINFNGTINSSLDIGIALNGKATLNVTGGTIQAQSSVADFTGVEVRAGTLNVEGGTITGKGTYSVAASGSGTTTTGAGIAVAQHTTKLPVTVSLTGGTISGTTGLSVADPQGNGTIAGTGSDAVQVTSVQSFTEDSTIPEGYEWVETETAGVYRLAKVGELVSFRSITLSSEIAINLYIRSTLDNGADASNFYVTYGGTTKQLCDITDTVKGKDGTYYHLRLGDFPAKQMTDKVHVTVKDGEDETAKVYLDKDYSIQEYCLGVIDSTESTASLKDLCKATLDYGTYSQLYFGHNTDDLANKGNYYMTLGAIPADYAFTAEGDLDALATYISSLSLKSRVIMNLYFKAVGGKTLSYTATGAEEGDTGGYHYVRFSGIAARNLGVAKEITVSDGTDSATLHASPLSIAYNNQDNASMGDVYKSLYNYFYYAKAYLG